MGGLLKKLDQKFLDYNSKEVLNIKYNRHYNNKNKESKAYSFGRAIKKLVMEPFTKLARFVQVLGHVIKGVGYLIASTRNKEKLVESKKEFKIALAGTVNILKTPIDVIVKLVAILISPLSPRCERKLNTWIHEQSLKLDKTIEQYKKECDEELFKAAMARMEQYKVQMV